MTFVKEPMTNAYRLLTAFIAHPQFAEFIIISSSQTELNLWSSTSNLHCLSTIPNYDFTIKNKSVKFYKIQRPFDAKPTPVPTMLVTLKKIQSEKIYIISIHPLSVNRKFFLLF